MFIIYCAVYFEFNNNYTYTFEISQLIFSKFIRIQFLLNFFFICYDCVIGFERQSRMSNMISYISLAHFILSLIFFFEMSKIYKSNSETLFQIISILCVITYVLIIMDFVYFMFIKVKTHLIDMFPWHMKIFLLFFSVMSQSFLFLNVIKPW